MNIRERAQLQILINDAYKMQQRAYKEGNSTLFDKWMHRKQTLLDYAESVGVQFKLIGSEYWRIEPRRKGATA